MPQNSAVAELTDLINKSNQELDALSATIKQTGQVDAIITTQILRTLHTIKGLTKMCSLPLAGDITHQLETVVDRLAKGSTEPTPEIINAIQQANTLLFSVVQHGQDAMQETIKKIQDDLNTIINNKLQQNTEQQKTQEVLDYKVFGMENDDVIQLSETEKLVLELTFKKKRPVIGYLVHLQIQGLEQNIAKISQDISANGTVITTIPTHSKQASFPYAFVFLFTTTLDKNDLQKILFIPGKITWIQQGSTPDEFYIGQAPIKQPQQIQPIKQAVQIETKTTQPLSSPPHPTPPKRYPRQQFISDNHTGPTKINIDAIEQKLMNNSQDATLHVSISKIDTLIDQNNKLISCKIKLDRLIKKLRTNQFSWDVVAGLEEQIFILDKNLKACQKAILNARLVQAEEIFPNLNRIVKSIALDSGKQIEFEMEGKDIEVDKSILDQLQNPLVHLIKNAADHGIKSSQERQDSGKSPEGHVRLTFENKDAQIVVGIEDDGDGLDIEAIKEKAVKLGFIDKIKAATMSDRELYQFIFYPGFSTKKELTQTSGRGIGMDAVKTAVEEMHGDLFFESVAGKGTKFTIAVPSFLSIQRLLRFAAGDNHYAIAFSQITEVLPYDKNLIQEVGDSMLYSWQGKSIEAINFSSLVSKKNNPPISDKPTQNKNVIILKKGSLTIAIVTDEIVGQEEIVARPLDVDDQKKHDFELFSGHADFGDEKLVLIINVEKFWEIIKNGKSK